MKSWNHTLPDALRTGTISSVATTVAVALCGAHEIGNAVAPINAVSHIAWGEEAARADKLSLQYTLTGFVVNASACASWALIYEKLCGESADENAAAALVGGALVSLLAYVVDYHIVPPRLTPGFEKRLSSRSLLAIYIVLALSLSASSLARKES